MAGGGSVGSRPQLDRRRSNLTAIPSPTEYFNSESNLTVLVYTLFVLPSSGIFFDLIICNPASYDGSVYVSTSALFLVLYGVVYRL